MFVRLRDRMRLFKAGTSDFSEPELVAIKDTLGQIYVDVSGKVAPDDFARDLRKLTLDPECARCDAYDGCPGCYHAVRADVFSRDDARVRDILRGLEGDVLDLGCGEGPYLDVLAARAAEGKLRYLGVDPDQARVALLGSRHPWARYEAGDIQVLSRLRAGPFDHVLILRSYNHLPDPGAVVDAAIAHLRVGGTLLVVDNVAFGLVRTEAHVMRAESGAAGFEHFRNDSSEEAAALLASRPLTLLERADVTPATSNQWLLRYKRMPEASP